VQKCLAAFISCGTGE